MVENSNTGDVQDPAEQYKAGRHVDTSAQHEPAEVTSALARETDDGKGDDEVPESDFVSYAAGETVLHEGPGDND